ncbi:serine/threonine-protein kinase [Salirhabdus euzebyi]|uniref:Serine/threonine-protein kinase PrkC n=1 Tax=Salirhabdus euzebyi TaxID=394506 RepID=A0A841Q3J3_9BACI|nr:Stk1 family PASTA domain-containing Ser/Thr kinase [Salirhabdus euzebyi]MBB6452971.1 serine/threonine-protein kinase [Salirhabdus euzebyi]
MFRGQLLNERYQIKHAIGGGGMANVYLAHDLILERDVAIKVLRMEYAHDEEFIERFRREAQSTISLSHPNIVNIFDVGEDNEDGIYYIVMEYVKGMTLKQYIQMYGPLPVEEAVDVMKQVTSAISHAHANEIIHRDIKPQNILINNSGKVKVTDFGIAMALSSTSVTQTNSVLGSVHYLSPEQARGGTAIRKSDIYSLGIVFFELLTGRLPFSGESAVSIALKHLQSETPSVRRWIHDIPQSVENVVLKATAKNPFHRYENAHQLEEDLATVLLPERYNENKYIPPQEEGEETKAIPIITSDNDLSNNHGETIIRKKNESAEAEKKKKKWKIWVIALITMLVIGGIAALFLLPKWLMPKEVEIISVEGMTYEEAYSELRALNLDVKSESRNSDTIEEGFVITTDPDAGSVVKEGSTVTIITSLGKEKKEFDNYVGQQFDQVERLLTSLNYKEITRVPVESDRPEGEIIAQSPDSGTPILPEETRVIFEVSSGPKKIVLQPLSGQALEDVERYLVENELNIYVLEEFSDDVPEGYVIKTEPAAFTEVEEGTEIKVHVSKGAEQKPVTKRVQYTVTVDNSNQGNGNGNGNGNADEQVEKLVEIYVEDMTHNFQDIHTSETISEDKTFAVDLTIAPDQIGRFKVVVDGSVVIDEKVPY